jgi:hypothetical protein
MAQGKVTDFFSTRKRNPALQPSKRRKVEITSTEVDISSLDRTNANPYRNLTQGNDVEPEAARKENTVFSPLQTRASRKAKTVQISSSTAKKSTRTRKTKVDPKQKLISRSFIEPQSAEPEVKGETTIAESVTSSWDDHDGGNSTPVKAEIVKITRKRARNGKTCQKEAEKNDEATPEKRTINNEPKKTETKARKKLQLKQTKV